MRIVGPLVEMIARRLMPLALVTLAALALAFGAGQRWDAARDARGAVGSHERIDDAEADCGGLDGRALVECLRAWRAAR